MMHIKLILVILSIMIPLAGKGSDLIEAARTGDLAQVQAQIKAGADVDLRDRYGSTALFQAVNGGHAEVVKALLAAKANPDLGEEFYGMSPMIVALGSNHADIAIMLLQAGSSDREFALRSGLQNKNLNLVKAAIESGPIHASTLSQVRQTVMIMDAPFKDLVEKAESRPDPPVPSYTEEELKAYTGYFDGHGNTHKSHVTLADGQLQISVNDAEPFALKVSAENVFLSEDGKSRLVYFGRMKTIEGIILFAPGHSRTEMRHALPELSAKAMNDSSSNTIKDVTTRNWPGFRGTDASGMGDGVDTPLKVDVKSGDGVAWQAGVPGLGLSSPIVWGDLVLVTTAVASEGEQELKVGLSGDLASVKEDVPHAWTVIAFDKKSGKKRWETTVGEATPETARHFKASQANSTPFTDGKHIAVIFPTAGLACLDMNGKVLWKKELGGLNSSAFFDENVQWGYASSPIIYDGMVITQVDVFGGGYIAARDVKTGKKLWATARDVAPSWATPNVLRAPSGDELVVNGSTIFGYDPKTGKELWRMGPNSEIIIATPLVDNGVTYVSAGYAPVKPILAIKAGTRGELDVKPGEDHKQLLWSHARGGAYMPTPLLYRGYFFIVHHDGRLVIYQAKDGKPIHKARFSQRGAFTASPIAVNGKVYAGTEEGLLYVFSAKPGFEELAVSDMGEPIMATPAVSEGTMFVRTPTKLYALKK